MKIITEGQKNKKINVYWDLEDWLYNKEVHEFQKSRLVQIQKPA